MPPVLFADRFFVARPGHAIDLATGDQAWIRLLTFPDHAAHEAWLARSAALSALWHPHLVALTDFGAAGRTYFEAWNCPPPATSRGCSIERQAARLDKWPQPFVPAGLDRSGRLGSGRPRVAGEHRSREGLVRAPGPCPAASDLIDRLIEVLDGGVSGRPRSVSLAVSEPVARSLAISAVARCARLRGYVPVSPRMLAPEVLRAAPGWRAAIEGRHVLVLQIEGEGLVIESGMFFLSLGLGNDRPHVLLTLAVPRWHQHAASGSWWPARTGRSAAGGTGRPGQGRVQLLREESAPYATDAVVAPWTPALISGTRYADPKVRPILEAAASGRHAQVERWLREAMGRCARRHDDAGAGDAALALGRLLLVRGQLAEALRAFDGARRHFDGARQAARAVCAAVFTGLSLTDGGRFCDAESALRAAVVAAEALSDNPIRSFAMQALARCLIWQVRPDEAVAILRAARTPAFNVAAPGTYPAAPECRRPGAATCARERLGTPSGPAHGTVHPFGGDWPFGSIEPAVAHACLQARASLATGDLAGAGRAAAEARGHALVTRRPSDLAAACRARALLFTVLGDLPATRQQVDEGLEAARRSHDPLRAIRLRMVLADALLRDGRDAEAKDVIGRLARLDVRRLPVVVGQPLERLVKGEAEGRPRPQVVVPFQPTRLGGARGTAQVPPAPLVDAFIDVLTICQEAGEERDVLRKAAASLRGRVRAVSVACLVHDTGAPTVLVNEGSGSPADAVGQRAIDSGLVIPPSSSRTGLEAAIPVRVSGLVVGAIACRWAADVPPDWPHAGALLAAAAAAIAPCVRATLDRQAAPTPDAVPGNLLGIGDAIRALREEIARAAPAPFNVVIEGESGSGKELVARAIHRLGPRSHRPLCALNCAALTDELIEAELFGHARGAFTGALSERKGLFEEAHLGILVLDEVGELTPRAQAKLLRAIQEGEVRRLGENTPRAVDVRIVAATNRPLRAAVEAGNFRRDLLYRLDVIRIVVPPLRARVEDIPVLAAHFWGEATRRVGSRCTLAPATLAALARYDWPGNVRELQNVMAALAVSSGRRGSVGPDRLPAVIARQAAAYSDVRNLDEARRLFEAGFVRAAIARAGGRRALAASDLGVTRQGLAKLMVRLGIE